MPSSEILSILANGPLMLAAIAGLAMATLMARSSRVLTVIGLLLVITHAGVSLLRDLVLYAYLGNHISVMTVDALSWFNYLVLIVGFLLLALAATAKPKPPAPPAPHHQPTPPAPHPGGAGPRPGA